MHLGPRQHPSSGAGRQGSPLHRRQFSPRGLPAAHPSLSQQAIRCLAPSLAPLRAASRWASSTPAQRFPILVLAESPLPTAAGARRAPRSLENVSLAHRQQLTALCRRRPGAPAVLISIVQAPCVSHSPPPLGFLLPANKHVALRFLDGGLCRGQRWPPTDHRQGLIFLSAGFYLQHDERLFLPPCILSHRVYCRERYFLLCFAGTPGSRGIFPAAPFPRV